MFSAEATDQVGLSSPVSSISGPSTCWIGVLVIDRTAPTITEASLELGGDEGRERQSRSGGVIERDHHRHGHSRDDPMNPLDIRVLIGTETMTLCADGEAESCCDAQWSGEAKSATINCAWTVRMKHRAAL